MSTIQEGQWEFRGRCIHCQSPLYRNEDLNLGTWYDDEYGSECLHTLGEEEVSMDRKKAELTTDLFFLAMGKAFAKDMKEAQPSVRAVMCIDLPQEVADILLATKEDLRDQGEAFISELFRISLEEQIRHTCKARRMYDQNVINDLVTRAKEGLIHGR